MKRTFCFLAILLWGFIAHGQSFTFTGTITDTKSQPLVGVSVHLLNTNLFSISDSLGKFSLPSVARGSYTLQFTALGYATQEKVLGTDDAVSIQLSENFTQLDDVVVTAQKQEENLQNIPVSVTPISERQIQEFRIWNSKDITAIVPNLYSANPGDGRNVTSIRGITSTSYDPSVATYIDGVNQFGLDTYIAQLFDVERIEVLRGPQGTLYGRNAMGGVVNIITKQPTNKTSGFVEATAGSFDQQRYTGAFRTPIINDKLFLGVSAVYDHSGGFYTNQFNNSKFDRKHSITGNYYLKYLPTLRWALTLNIKHNQNRNSGAFPLAYQNDAEATPFLLNQDAIAKMVDDVFNASFSAVHSGTKLNFSSQTSYQSNYRYYRTPIDADFSPADGISIVNNYGRKFNNTKVVTQEFKFTSPTASVLPFQWTAGSYLFYQYSPVRQGLRYGIDAPLVGVPDSLFTTISTTKAHSAGAALYGQMSYTIANKLKITGGLRYGYERKSQSINEQYQHDPAPELIETRSTTWASVSFGAVSPKVIVSWQLAESNTLYGSWSRGYRTGGLTAYSSDPSQPPLSSYKPEYSNNLEIGSKNTFLDNHLRANVSLFYISVTDAQYPKFVIPGNIISNAGSLTSKGAELELSANPFKGLQLNYNLGVNDSKFRNAVSNESFAGKHQIFSPPVTSMLAIQYGLTFSDKVHAFVRGEWMYLGKTYFNYDDTPLMQNGYSLLNARAGVSFSGFELSVWARNVGDRHYIDYAYDFGAVHLGNPRNYGVTLRKNF